MEETKNTATGPVTVALAAPVEHGSEMLTGLTIRPIRTKDLIEIGNIYTMASDGEDVGIDINMKRVAKYLSRLAALPPSVIARLSMPDFMACQEVVLSFFGQSGRAQTPQTLSGSSSILPGSGA
ncbi:MAG: phage tail assembly protein [Oxalobacter formigenes]|nr:phage tail assembly protein [Oxalobacter formigenes]